MKKTIISIVLLAIIAGLTYVLVQQFAVPMEFDEERDRRENEVIDRLKDIRTAQRLFKTQNAHFAASFNELVNFIQNDSLELEIAIGSEDDSAAQAQGKVQRVKYKVAIKDTLHFTENINVNELGIIPNSEFASGKKLAFQMDTASVVTESKVTVPVFVTYAPYTAFLKDMDVQELANYIDLKTKTLGKDAGLKVGDLNQANNEAGNWE